MSTNTMESTSLPDSRDVARSLALWALLEEGRMIVRRKPSDDRRCLELLELATILNQEAICGEN